MGRSLYARLHRRYGQRLPGPERARIVRGGVADVRDLHERMFAAGTLPVSVGVVGGGFAGLAAGWATAMMGARVTVLEAQDHVGGRVKSSVDGVAAGRVIEQGGELIGIIHRAWIYSAEYFGLGFSVITGDDDYDALRMEMPLVLNGQPVPPSQLPALYGGMTAVLDQMTADATQVDPYSPWSAPNAAAWDAMSLQDWLDRQGADPLVAAAITVQVENNNARPLSQQSYLSQLAQVAAGGFGSDGTALFWTENENFRCESGNQSLAFAMADRIESLGGSVVTNAPVTRVSVLDGGGGVQVASALGTQTFDYVVLALPQAAYGGLTIDPPLPDGMAMQVGPVAKWLSVVDGRWWIPQQIAPSGMSNLLGDLWEGTDNQMTVPGQQIELSVFAGGTAAQDALDQYQRDPEGMAAYYAPRVGQLLPGYPDHLLAGTFMPWPLTPYIDGGYSCPAPGQVTTVMPFLNRVWQGRVAFAGEHTSPGFYGFMEGALESGVAAAIRLATTNGTMDVSRLAGVRGAPVTVG